MHPKVINPYIAFGAQHKESLDYLIANLPVQPAFDDFNKKLTESFFTPDPNDPGIADVAVEVMQTMLPHAYNGYANGGQLAAAAGRRFNENQIEIISRMLKGVHQVPVEAISEFLSGIEAEIVAGKLSYEEQIPLLLAAQIGKSDHEYWQAQIAAPGAWAVYLNADSAINLLHVASWVNAAMQGALLAYGLIKPPQVQLIDLFSSTIASAGLAAGTVMFGWVGQYG